MATCVDELVRQAKGQLTKREAEDIIRKVQKKYNRPMPEKLGREAKATADYAVQRGESSAEQRMFVAAREAFEEAVAEKKEKLRRRQLQVDAAARNQYIVATHGGGMVDGVVDLLVGRKDGKFKEQTLAGRIRGIREILLGELAQGLQPFLKATGGKLTEAEELEVATHIMDPDLARRFAYSEKLTPAQQLAVVFRNVEDSVIRRKNEAGAAIQYLAGHLPQQWSPEKVRTFGLTAREKATFLNPFLDQRRRNRLRYRAQENWVDHTLPLLDRERYHDPETGAPLDDAQMREVLGEVWTTLATNGLAHLDPALAGAQGEASLAERLGVHRELHFKDPEAFLAANRAYGTKDLFTAITGNIDRHASEIGMLEAFGPNPDAGFKTVLDYAKSSQAEKTLFGREGSTLAENVYNELRGVNNVAPEEKYQLVSSFMQGTRHLITAAKMGMLLLSQVNDVATFRAIAQSDGLDTGRAFRIALKMLDPTNAADRNLAMRHAILASSVIQDVAQRYGQAAMGEGITSKLASWTVMLSGAEYWTKAMKQGYSLLIGSHVHDAAKGEIVSFEALDGRFGEMLRRYGIEAADWEIIRQAEAVELGGVKVITPATVARVFTADMAQDGNGRRAVETEKAAARLVRQAAEKYAGMLAEETDVAMLTPGVRESAIIKQGTKPGTLAGELLRSMFLFKTFSVAMLTKALPRILAAGPEGGGPGMSRARIATEFAIAATIAGGLSIQLKEIAKGRNPRDMSTMDFVAASLMQSGGMGIFGDYFFADANRFGGGMANTLAGPVAGFANDVQKLTVGNAMQAAEGKDPHLGAEAIQFAKNYAPVMNTWYTRLALDHLFFHHVQEAINPGFLRRMQQRVERENNQTWWWGPTQDAPEAPDLAYAFGGSRR